MLGVWGVLASSVAFAAAELPVREVSPSGVDARTAKNTPGWAGTYSGMLPCADCNGIETLLTLNPDDTYRLRSTYLGRDARVFEETGRFTWRPDGHTVELDGAEPRLFQVADGKLFSLDREGKRVEGALADKYVLLQHQPGQLAGQAWHLTELRGQNIVLPEARVPYLEFRDTEGAVAGFGGCNRLRGGYQVDGAGGIVFSQIATTMMACMGSTDIEPRFLRVLEQVQRYAVEDGTLVLYRTPAGGPPVVEARFMRAGLEKVK